MSQPDNSLLWHIAPYQLISMSIADDQIIFDPEVCILCTCHHVDVHVAMETLDYKQELGKQKP